MVFGVTILPAVFLFIRYRRTVNTILGNVGKGYCSATTIVLDDFGISSALVAATLVFDSVCTFCHAVGFGAS